MSLDTITTVYSYRFPEIRGLIDELVNPFPHEVFLSATEPPGNLDNFHEPIVDKIIDFYSDFVLNLKDFKFRYPTSGSEEGIREVFTKLQTDRIKEIYVFEGEYEGYKAVAETRGIKTIEVPYNQNPNKLKQGYWFLSNPSARDGNIIPNEKIMNICDAGHQLFYDMAYLGSTKQHEFDIDHENIFASVVSFSKPFGLFYDRIGFAFSKEAIPSLYGNKWFKSVLGLMIAEKVVDNLNPLDLYNKYRPMQENIIDSINQEFELGMKPSDALLLANINPEDTNKLTEQQKELIGKFQRGTGYRFCLTPYYRQRELE